jgi:lipid-A-disaccharide synthase-like uncharacterized protein
VYRSRWQVPRDPRWTVALLALWLVLAVYIIWTRDAIGIIILALVGLFVFLPALVIWLGTKRASQHADDADPHADGNAPPGEHVVDTMDIE